MRDFDDTNITDAVLKQVRKCTDTRSRAVFDALVRHMHAFIQEVEPTEEEWAQGIKFLTETGQMCSETRQEFILLSDTLGVSMLVDAINHRSDGAATETTVLGPFYVDEPPKFDLGADISGGAEGVPLWVEGVVHDAKGQALADAVVDTWHSGHDGFYDVQTDSSDFKMRARLRTDENGRYYFRTVQPTFYPIPSDGPVGKMLAAQRRHSYRPAHVHFMISAPGHETLITHVFLDDDPYLDSDVVFGVKNSLIKKLEPVRGDHGIDNGVKLTYDFRLKTRSHASS